MKVLFQSVLLTVIFSTYAFSQETAKPRLSPLALATAHYKDTYLKIVYSQPQKHAREVFGKLVPYDQVWRTGANEATEVTLTKEILINGTTLKAGTYSLFTIPGREKWTVIINSDLGLWGSYNYNSKADVLRFDVPAKLIADNVVYDSFTIRIDQKTDTAEVFLLWDKTQIDFPIQFIEPKP